MWILHDLLEKIVGTFCPGKYDHFFLWFLGISFFPLSQAIEFSPSNRKQQTVFHHRLGHVLANHSKESPSEPASHPDICLEQKELGTHVTFLLRTQMFVDARNIRQTYKYHGHVHFSIYKNYVYKHVYVCMCMYILEYSIYVLSRWIQTLPGRYLTVKTTVYIVYDPPNTSKEGT